MGFYPRKVEERCSLLHSGRARGAGNASATAVSFECGCFVRFSLQVTADESQVTAAEFNSNGCGFMIAAADTLAEALQGRSLADLHGLDPDELFDAVESTLGHYPHSRRQCARIPIEALRAAFAKYRSHRIAEFASDTALICTCFGVSEDTVHTLITERVVASVEDVTARVRAGGGCGSCRMLIQEMLDAQSWP